MDVINEVLANLNTWLVMFLTGLVIWIIRQVTPDVIEEAKWFKLLLKLSPLVIGTGIALIPGLQPMPDNLAQSGAIGLIGGSFASNLYKILRDHVNAKIAAAIGSKSDRKKENGSDEE